MVHNFVQSFIDKDKDLKQELGRLDLEFDRNFDKVAEKWVFDMFTVVKFEDDQQERRIFVVVTVVIS